MRIIYTGKQFVAFRERRAQHIQPRARFIPPTAWKHVEPLFHVKHSTDYGPRPLLEAARDHCRFFINAKHICGERTISPESSWCPKHHAICIAGRASDGSEITAISAVG